MSASGVHTVTIHSQISKPEITMSEEKKPMTHRRKQSSGQFYFVSHNPGLSESIRNAGDFVNGTHSEEFNPKPVNRNLEKEISLLKQSQNDRSPSKQAKTVQQTNFSRRLLSIFAESKQPTNVNEGAKKVDPKLFFANERTFLKWMNVSVWVAGISVGLSSIAGNTAFGLENLFSLLFLAIAMVTVIHTMVQYGKRSLMIVKRSPGPYEDRWGPIAIGSLFAFTFTAQYCLFLASLSSGHGR